MFTDRLEAGKALAEAVAKLDLERPVVLALPRGGVPVAAEVARRLKAPLGLLIVRKLGVPGHEELAAGAVGGGTPPVTVFNTHVLAMIGMTEKDFAPRIAEKAREIEERRKKYLGDQEQPEVKGATAIVVDDGIATGATVKAALEVLRKQGAAKVVLAVPVAPEDAVAEFKPRVDELVCLQTPEPYIAVGAHYAHFPQTSDAEVVELLRAAGSQDQEKESK
jgi:predicted phosphoribosyltransferase